MTAFHHGPMTAFDLETTGLNLEADRVVTACVAHIPAAAPGTSRTPDVRSWLIAVDIDIPEAATAVHGISTEFAQTNGMPAAEVLDLIAGDLALALSRGAAIVAMNVVFDLTILDRDCRRYGVPTLCDRLDGKPIAPVIDIYVLDKALDRYRPGKRKLTDLCALYDAVIDGAHDSTHDALGAARVAWRMGQRAHLPAGKLRALYADRKYPDRLVRDWQALAGMSLADLHARQVEWYREQSESFAQYLRKEANQKRADAARGYATDEERAIAEQEADELDARIDGMDGHWPLKPTNVAEEAIPA